MMSYFPAYRYVNTARLPQSLTDEYQPGSPVASHGTDFITLFHYADDDSDEFKRSKRTFRSIVSNFMINGTISGWEPYPAVYNISSTQANITASWTAESCNMWKSPFYPDYSWMN